MQCLVFRACWRPLPSPIQLSGFSGSFRRTILGEVEGLYATIDSELGASFTKNNTVHFLPHTRFESLCQLDASGLSRTLPMTRMEVVKFTPNEKKCTCIIHASPACWILLFAFGEKPKVDFEI